MHFFLANQKFVDIPLLVFIFFFFRSSLWNTLFFFVFELHCLGTVSVILAAISVYFDYQKGFLVTII